MLLEFIFHFILFFFGTTSFFDFQNYLCKNGYINPHLWTIHGDTGNFNIALPDSYAVYKGSFVCLNHGESLIIEGIIPNARYYSVQVYDSTTRSLGSINDHQMNTKVEESGNFSVTIKRGVSVDNPDGNILHVNTNNSFLIVLYRLYDTENFELPTVYKNTKYNKLENSGSHAIINFPRMYPNKEPIREHRFANEKNNFFKPTVASYFNNDDANYLVSLIKVHLNESLGAIIEGYLPLTSSTTDVKNDYFKSSKYVNTNDSDYYEVRYISFNMGTTSFPLPTIGGKMLHSKFYDIDLANVSSTGKPGIRDVDIIKRYYDTPEWNDGSGNRPYKIYIGMDVEHIKKLGADPKKDLYLIYPISYRTNEQFTYASVIHRHVMPQSKFLSNPLFNQSVGDIKGDPVVPTECKEVMGKYYPNITFINTDKMEHYCEQ